MFGRVASYGVSLLPVSDTKELSVRQPLFPATFRSEWLSSMVACSIQSHQSSLRAIPLTVHEKYT